MHILSKGAPEISCTSTTLVQIHGIHLPFCLSYIFWLSINIYTIFDSEGLYTPYMEQIKDTKMRNIRIPVKTFHTCSGRILPLKTPKTLGTPPPTK